MKHLSTILILALCSCSGPAPEESRLTAALARSREDAAPLPADSKSMVSGPWLWPTCSMHGITMLLERPHDTLHKPTEVELEDLKTLCLKSGFLCNKTACLAYPTDCTDSVSWSVEVELLNKGELLRCKCRCMHTEHDQISWFEAHKR